MSRAKVVTLTKTLAALNLAQQSGIAGVREQLDRAYALISAANSHIMDLERQGDKISREDLGMAKTLLNMAEEELSDLNCINRIERGTFED